MKKIPWNPVWFFLVVGPSIIAVIIFAFGALRPTTPPTPAELQAAAENESWQACAATWSLLEHRVWDGLSYEHESAIIRLSHTPAGCADGRTLLHSLGAYPADRRDDTFDLATSPP